MGRKVQILSRGQAKLLGHSVGRIACTKCSMCYDNLSVTVSIFTARRYASAVYAAVVCPSVRLSHAGIVGYLNG